MRTTRHSLSRLAVLLMLVAAPASAEDLLANGEFTDDVAGWASPGPGVEVLYRPTEGSTLLNGSGPGCLEVQLFIYRGGSAGAWQSVAVEAGRSYHLATSYYYPASADNVADNIVLVLEWMDAAGGDVDWTYTRAEPLVADSWSQLMLDATAPAGAALAVVSLHVGNPNLQSETRPGIAYFDDVFFGPHAGPAVVDVLFLPAAAATPGLAGTEWSTTLWVASLADVPVTVRAAMLHQDTDNTPAFDTTQTLGTVPPQGQLEIADVIGALGESGAGGLIVFAEADSGAPPLVQLASRTSTPNESGAGSYGQGIGALRGGGTGVQVAPGAVVDDAFRTNAGVLNLSATYLSLEVTVVDAAGTEVASTTWTLPPFAHHQVSLRSMGVDRLDGGSVRFSWLSNHVPFAAYLSIVDQATGDPTFIAAQ